MKSTDGISMPASTVDTPDKVMYWGNAYKKTIKITNNTDAILYPILEGQLSALASDGSTAMYDDKETSLRPCNDAVPAEDRRYWVRRKGSNEEYRVYIGYQRGGSNYLGLLPHSSVTVPVPMAIWDSGRLNIVLDTPVTRELCLKPEIPFLFDPEPPPDSPRAKLHVHHIDGSADALCLLYHAAEAHTLLPDAPSQLVEFTFRDREDLPQGVQADQKTVKIGYNVSYVDHLFLPVAMEGIVPGQTPDNQVGFFGSIDSVDTFQSKLRSFIDGTDLGGYFNGKGWPAFHLSKPIDPNQPNPDDLVKIPSGYNVLLCSTSPSSYDTSKGMLTSSQAYDAMSANGDNYAVLALTNLWFSWARYHMETTNAKPSLALAQLLNQKTVQTFSIVPGRDSERAAAFSQTVWDVMETFSQHGLDDGIKPHRTTQFLGFIIGDNVADLNLSKQAEAANNNKIISLLEGVPDHTDVAHWPETSWYPPPGDPQTDGVAKYNLNPFVWFVHRKLGKDVYAYAFSIDDASGYVEVANATRLEVAIGGSNGLSNPGIYVRPGKG